MTLRQALDYTSRFPAPVDGFCPGISFTILHPRGIHAPDRQMHYAFVMAALAHVSG
jgi:hypothetical protein